MRLEQPGFPFWIENNTTLYVFTSNGGSWSFFQEASDPFKLKANILSRLNWILHLQISMADLIATATHALAYVFKCIFVEITVCKTFPWFLQQSLKCVCVCVWLSPATPHTSSKLLVDLKKKVYYKMSRHFREEMQKTYQNKQDENKQYFLG